MTTRRILLAGLTAIIVVPPVKMGRAIGYSIRYEAAAGPETAMRWLEARVNEDISRLLASHTGPVYYTDTGLFGTREIHLSKPVKFISIEANI